MKQDLPKHLEEHSKLKSNIGNTDFSLKAQVKCIDIPSHGTLSPSSNRTGHLHQLFPIHLGKGKEEKHKFHHKQLGPSKDPKINGNKTREEIYDKRPIIHQSTLYN